MVKSFSRSLRDTKSPSVDGAAPASRANERKVLDVPVTTVEKLEAFTPKVGYPERWRDYSSLETDPADLLGKLVVVVANLAPRTMKFGVSEGMIIAAGPGGDDIFLLAPDEGAVPGQRVS